MKKKSVQVFCTLILITVGLVKFKDISQFVYATTSGWAISGDNVYFTDGNVGIGTSEPEGLLHVKTTVDLNDTPVLKSAVYDGDGEFSRLGSNIHEIKVVGNYAYVYGENALTIMDISDPTNPILESEVYDGDGEFSYLAQPGDLFVQGNYAYITSMVDHSMTTIDISNPTDPDMQSEIYNGDGEFARLEGANDVWVDGNYAYVVSGGSNGFTIIDISNPADPLKKVEKHDGQWSRLASAYSVFVSGNYAYVTSVGATNALLIIDVTSKTSPILKSDVYDGDGEFSRLNEPTEVRVSGNYAYVTSFDDNAVTVMDISDPTDPDLVAEIYDGDGEFSKLEGPLGLEIIGNYLYVTSATENALNIIDISNPANPALVKVLEDGVDGFDRFNSPKDVEVKGNYAYFGTGSTDKAVNIIEVIRPTETLFTNSEANVGIQTIAPKATLDVNGFMKLKKNTSAPATCNSDTDGALGLTSTYKLCSCKSGTGWVYTSDGSTTCSW